MPMALPKHVKPAPTLARWPAAKSQVQRGIEIPVRRHPTSK